MSFEGASCDVVAGERVVAHPAQHDRVKGSKRGIDSITDYLTFYRSFRVKLSDEPRPSHSEHYQSARAEVGSRSFLPEFSQEPMQSNREIPPPSGVRL